MPAEIKLALDRSSVRSIDQDGHLHVSVANISKACVNPYLGREINEVDPSLGLDPDRTYQMLRDPEELAAAASTFNGKQLLDLHKPQHASTHDHDLTVGNVNNVRFEDPYLKAELHVWEAGAIAAIQSGVQQELSAGYRYKPDMTPGEHQGQKYDGVMRSIIGNHVAIVEQGRAGPDVVIGDSAPTKPLKSKDLPMAKAPRSRKALLATGALSAYLAPKIAADAKVDISPVMKNVTAKTWKTDKPKIKAGLEKITAGKLAQDADLEDVIELLDKLDDVSDEVADVIDDPAPPPAAAEDDDVEMMSRLKGVLKAKGMSDEDIEAVMAEMKPEVKPAPAPAMDAPKPEAKPDTVTKTAMDAAIKVASDKAAHAAEQATIARLRSIQAAERDVRPFIGELAVAQDSAPAVYKLALDHAGVDLTDVPPEAYGALLRAIPKPGEGKPQPRIATDSAAMTARAARFPNADRLKSH